MPELCTNAWDRDNIAQHRCHHALHRAPDQGGSKDISTKQGIDPQLAGVLLLSVAPGVMLETMSDGLCGLQGQCTKLGVQTGVVLLQEVLQGSYNMNQRPGVGHHQHMGPPRHGQLCGGLAQHCMQAVAKVTAQVHMLQ